MLKITIFLAYIFVINACFGQQQNTNSKNQIKLLADSLYKQGNYYQEKGEYPKSLFYFDESFKKYNKINDMTKAGDCFSSIAITHYYQGNYSKAESFFEKSINFYKKVNNQKSISAVLNNLGGVQYILGNYPKSLDFYKEALTIQEKIGEKEIICASIKNIGGIYIKVNDYSNAIKFYNRALKISKQIKNLTWEAQCQNSIGSALIKQHKYIDAEVLLNKAIRVANELKDNQLQIEILSNLGELYFSQNDFTKAKNYYTQCLELSKKINSQQYKADSQIALGKIFYKNHNYNLAIKNCEIGLKISEKIGAISSQKDACTYLYKSYKQLGSEKKALYFYEKENKFNDSLNAEATSNKILNMEYQQQLLLDSISYVKKKHLIQLKHKEEIQKKEKQRNMIIISLGFIVLIAIGLWNRLMFVKKSRAQIKIEKDRSEELLLNILPFEIAEELKANGYVSARDFNQVAILFTDFKSFTQTAEKMSPKNLVEEINICFKEFDLICTKYNIEKIKTIGDSYMAAGGIPNPENYTLKNIVLAGLEMQEVMVKRKEINAIQDKPSFEMRLGIHAGPIVAGIVGVKKFQYDVWGDTVNTASRIESSGMVGKVNISESLYYLIKDEDCFIFEYRGKIEAKGKGEIKMYFVEKAI